MANLSTFRLPPSIFNASLVSRVYKVWFGDLPANATFPNAENTGKWFGLNRTREERQAFDSQLRDEFGPALAAISPSQLHLPPFRDVAADRAQAHLLSAPFRRLDVLRHADDADDAARARAGLSLVLLLDQVPRNIFRKPEEQGQVFGHYDRLARALAYMMMLPAPVHDANGDVEGGEDGLADIYGLHLAPSLRPSLVRRTWFYLPLMHSEDLSDHDLWREGMKVCAADMEATGDEAVIKYTKEQEKFEVGHRSILERFGRYPHRNPSLGREDTKEEREFLDGGGETFSAK